MNILQIKSGDWAYGSCQMGDGRFSEIENRE